MNQNLDSITQIFNDDKEYLLRFRRVLVKPDQWIIDDLLAFAEKHVHAVVNAEHNLPFVMFLFAMVVEQQKKIRKLEDALNALKEGKRE